MPKGVYPRERIEVHRFSITFHEDDWPTIQQGFARSGQPSIAAYIRSLVFKALGHKETKRAIPELYGDQRPRARKRAGKGRA